MDAAKEQMNKALHGPDGFEPGTPIDFKRFARPTDYSSRSMDDACFSMMLGGNPVGYMPTFAKGGVDSDNFAIVGPCWKKDMAYSKDPKHCGGCAADHSPLVCSKSKVQVYCSKACQLKDFKRRKVCCRTPADAESMKDEGLWNNMFFVTERSNLDSLASFSHGDSPFVSWAALVTAKLNGMEHARHFGVRSNSDIDLPL
jgi:hypothetical protein